MPTFLSKIMEFVYKGKTDVDQENLEAFLDAARVLKIKGLVDEVIDVDNDMEEGCVETGFAKLEVKEDAEEYTDHAHSSQEEMDGTQDTSRQ